MKLLRGGICIVRSTELCEGNVLLLDVLLVIDGESVRGGDCVLIR